MGKVLVHRLFLNADELRDIPGIRFLFRQERNYLPPDRFFPVGKVRGHHFNRRQPGHCATGSLGANRFCVRYAIVSRPTPFFLCPR